MELADTIAKTSVTETYALSDALGLTGAGSDDTAVKTAFRDFYHAKLVAEGVTVEKSQIRVVSVKEVGLRLRQRQRARSLAHGGTHEFEVVVEIYFRLAQASKEVVKDAVEASNPGPACDSLLT